MDISRVGVKRRTSPRPLYRARAMSPPAARASLRPGRGRGRRGRRLGDRVRRPRGAGVGRHTGSVVGDGDPGADTLHGDSPLRVAPGVVQQRCQDAFGQRGQDADHHRVPHHTVVDAVGRSTAAFPPPQSPASRADNPLSCSYSPRRTPASAAGPLRTDRRIPLTTQTTLTTRLTPAVIFYNDVEGRWSPDPFGSRSIAAGDQPVLDRPRPREG